MTVGFMRIVGLVSSALLAFALYWLLWGGHTVTVTGVDDAMRTVCAVSVLLFIYLFIQAWAAHTPPMHISVLWALDVVFSVLPLFIACAAILANMNFAMPLTTFQWIVVILSATAAAIDLALIAVFFQGHRPQREEHAQANARK